MEEFLNSKWFGIVSLVGLIALGIYHFLDPKVKARHSEYDQAGDGLIKLLKDTKDELSEENRKLKADFELLRERFTKVEDDNHAMKLIFQGRDQDTIKFRDKGFEAFETVKYTNDLISKTHAKVMAIEKKVYSS